MNTGIPTITNRPAADNPAQAGAGAGRPAGASPESSRSPGEVSLPVNSNSSQSVSESGSSKPQDAQDKPTLQEVIELSEKLNENVQRIQRDLNFTVDENLGEIVVKVIDRSTQEIIRQIPSEEMLTLSRNIEEVNSLLFDKIKA